MGKMGEEFLEFCWHTYGETRNGGRLGKHIGFKIENDEFWMMLESPHS
jgi:hypothetical protein